MLGRQARTSLLRLPQVARLPIRSRPYQQYDLPVRTVYPFACRFYAEITPSRPGRPKKAVGEPSRPVKRAVKRAAKSPKEDAPAKQVRESKKAAQEKPKKSAGKAAPKKKKQLTEEQKAKKAETLAKRKARQAEKVKKANVAELKKIALKPPRIGRLTAYTMFVRENKAEYPGQGVGPAERNASFAQASRTVSEAYRNITPAELEHYNHLRQTQKEKDEADYKRFVESHSLDEIEAANKARARLRRHYSGDQQQAKKWQPIKDERAVKKPSSAFILFSRSRWASGDFKNITVADGSKLVGQEWKALAQDEKEKYENLSRQDAERYSEEYSSVFGHAPEGALGGQRAQAAAVA